MKSISSKIDEDIIGSNKEDLKLIPYYKITYITTESLLVKFISEKIDLPINLSPNQRVYFDSANDLFMRKIDSKEFKSFFKNLIKQNYIVEIKKEFLNFNDPLRQLNLFSSYISDYNRDLSDYRFKNKIETTSKNNFQELLNVIQKQLNKLNLYLLSNKTTYEQISSSNLNDSKNESEDFFSDIFKLKETYFQFLKYLETHIPLDFSYPDYSYLFGRLAEEKLIHNHPAKDIFNWLESNEIIPQEHVDKLYENQKFSSLEKVDFKNRKGDFNSIFKINSQ